MILDKIENYKLYANINNRINKAFEYLINNNFEQIKPGKYTIDGDNIFALVQEYDTKEKEDGKLEGHYKYIDIQYLIKGSEQMGVTSLTNQMLIIKDIEKDYAFYDGDCSYIKVNEGMFTVFFPEDLHKPCIKLDKTSKVKKVVVKVSL